MKICTKCGESKDQTEYYKDSRYPNRLRPTCKVCHNTASTQNYENNKRAWRATFYQRRYGISIERFEEMLAKQNDVCAVCLKPETSKKFEHLSVDHDHETGRVRGLLCAKCNRLLGIFEKNPGLFEAFEVYLHRSLVVS